MTKLKRMFWKTINERTNKYESDVKNVLEKCKQSETKMTKKKRMSKRKLVLFVTGTLLTSTKAFTETLQLWMAGQPDEAATKVFDYITKY